MQVATEHVFDPITVRIPARNFASGHLELTIRGGSRYFVVGANGSGKSALVQRFVQSIQPPQKVYRLSAHRQTWLPSDSAGITASARPGIDQRVTAEDLSSGARCSDTYASQRLSAVLFDLVAAENRRARDIANAVDRDDVEDAKVTAKTCPSLFGRINAILRAGNLSFRLDAVEGEKILAHHGEASPFSIAKLSDGERNALILAAAVLTVKSGTVLVIDEPERHLHQSIIEPLLITLLGSRMDCPFIVSTHELSLPLSAPDATVLLPRYCLWNGDHVTAWNIDVLEPGTDLPDDLKKSVLGAKKRILFVEGEAKSLDVSIYGLLFPEATVIPKGASTKVIRAVDGLKAAEQLHWVHAYGLVDRDDRSDKEVLELESRGICALPVHSAEAIFFSNVAMRRLAKRQAETLGVEADCLFYKATEAALEVLSCENVKRRLCARMCERGVRELTLSKMPRWQDIQESDEIAISVPVKRLYEQEIDKYTGMIQERDLEGLVSRYPVRESGALDRIAKTLEFISRARYDEALLARAEAEPDFREELRSLLGSLPVKMTDELER